MDQIVWVENLYYNLQLMTFIVHGKDTMFNHHIIDNVIQNHLIVLIPGRNIKEGVHHLGSSFKDGSNSPKSITKDSISQTVGLGHDQVIPMLTGSEPMDH